MKPYVGDGYGRRTDCRSVFCFCRTGLSGNRPFSAVTDEEALNAAFCLTEMEGIIPALESAHALAVLEQKTFRPEEIVVINLSGRGDKDMQTYKRMNKFFLL